MTAALEVLANALDVRDGPHVVHAGEIVRSMAVPSQKIRQIPRGVDLGLFANSQRNKAAFEDWGLNGEPKLLYVGRLSKEKSIHQLLAAFERVRRPDARLVLVGDGPMTPELRRARADGKLVLTGPQHGARLAELYASADVFVFPSETETFGNVVVEAQASGVPVIVSRRGAACEHMVEGVTGFAVDIREPAQFGLAIERMLNDDAMRASMGEEAARFARRYDMVEAVRGTFKEYASILNDIEGPTWDNSSPSELARAS